MKCPICQCSMSKLFETAVLGKYPATYFKCPQCEIIKPENPSWLSESYSSAIAETDVGLVSRNLMNRDLLGPILTLLHPSEGIVLDVGGGYGLLCRLLRDKGWHCYTIDSYCQNLFASPFEPSGPFKAPTLLAFEVFEHIENPLEFVHEQIHRYSPETFVISTLTHAWDVPPLDWWYYAFETGQHISLYTRKTLEMIAQKIGWYLFSPSNEMHIFTRTKIGSTAQFLLNRKRRLVSRGYRQYIIWLRRSKSLMADDYRLIKEKVIQTQSSN